MATETLVAGPELDAEIARRVLGWRVIDGEGTYVSETAHRQFPDAPVPPFSTDIAAAWLVVEKMNGHFPDDYLWVRFSIGYLDGWHVCFVRPGSSLSERVGPFDTAPLAICHAALAALEGTDAGDTG